MPRSLRAATIHAHLAGSQRHGERGSIFADADRQVRATKDLPHRTGSAFESHAHFRCLVFQILEDDHLLAIPASKRIDANAPAPTDMWPVQLTRRLDEGRDNAARRRIAVSRIRQSEIRSDQNGPPLPVM